MTPLPIAEHVDAWLDLRELAPGAAALVLGTLLVGLALYGALRWSQAMLSLIRSQGDRDLEIYDRGFDRGYTAGRRSRRGDPDDD